MIDETISHYRIVGLLGRGGMGEVYEAEDVRLGRRVALKVLPPGARGDGEARARLEREARAASRLDHPNVGAVYEIGETGGGGLYIAMAYYEGRTLREIVGEGPLPVDRAVDLARQVAGGLGAAHRAGVVHRDVKPENVVVTLDGTAKVIDFGVATVAGAETLTSTGAVTGSAAYMAPEQARGGRVDAQADVWAAGVVLYEMLAGRRPFDGAYAQAVLYQVTHEEPPDLRALRPDVPEAVAGVVARCLRKDPAGRYADGGAVLDALDAGVPPTAAVEPRGGWRTSVRPWLVAAAGALAVVLAAAFWPEMDEAGALYEAGRLELREYFDPAHLASAAGYFRDALVEDSLYAPAWAGLAETEVHIGKLSGDTARASAAREFAERAVLLDPRGPDGHVAGGLVELWTGDVREALGHFQMARHLDPTHAGAWLGIGDTYLALDEPGAATNAYRKATELAPDDWGGFNKLGMAHYHSGDNVGAERYWSRAVELSPGNVDARSNRGAALHRLGEFAEAEGVFRDLVAATPGAYFHANLGTSLFFQGRYREAADQYERSLGYDSTDSVTWGELAAAYEQLPGQEALAREAYEQAASALQATSGWEDDPLYVAELASYRAALGDREGAQRLARRASAPPPSSVDAQIALGTTYARLGDRGEADRWVCAAVQAGYSPRLVVRSPDLAGLRGEVEAWATCSQDDG